MPNDHTWADASYFGVVDRGLRVGRSKVKVKQGGEDVRANFSTTFGDDYQAQAHIESSTKPIRLSDEPEEFADRY